jgi:subtilisin family serine protease
VSGVALAALGAMAAVVAPAWAGSQDGVIVASKGPVVPNAYIAVFKDSKMAAGNVDTQSTILSGKFGGKVSYRYHAALKGFSVTDMSEAQAKKLAADPSVAYVQHVNVVKLDTTEPTGPAYWNLDRIDQHNLPLDQSYTYPTTASNVHAYVIDTGIRITHQEFGGRASYGIDETNGSAVADDCFGHGTHVAGTIGGTVSGVAKGVNLVAVKVFDCTTGQGRDDWVAQGIDWVISNAIKPAVINLSLGLVGSDPLMETAVAQAVSSGIVVTVAAGNGITDANNVTTPINACDQSPADVPSALTVAASDESDSRSWFSNYGSCVDLFAPGSDVTSAWPANCPTPTTCVPSDTATAVLSGTSMAAPAVAGAAALILGAHPGYTPDQVRTVLVGGASGVVNNAGPGSPNLLLYVRNAEAPTIVGKAVVLYNPRFGTTEVYARSSDNHLVYTYWNGVWSSWKDLGGNLAGDPTVIYNPRFGTTEAYVRTSTNTLAYIYFSNGWSGWNDLAGTLAGNPSVIYNPRFGTTEAYVRTSTNTLAYRYFSNGWSSWNDLQGDVQSDPAVMYNPRFGTTEAYVRTSANEIQYRYYSNGWSNWLNIHGTAAGNPAVMYNPRFGTTEVYVRTATNTLSYAYWSGGWSSWNDLQGNLASDPALLFNPRFGTTEVYVRTATNTLAYRYYSNGWSSWNDLQGDLAAGPTLIFNPRFGTTEVYNEFSTGHAEYRFFSSGWSDWIDTTL